MEIDNSQFTDEQRTEAYRREHIGQQIRQTKALESIRGILVGLAVLAIFSVIVWLITAVIGV